MNERGQDSCISRSAMGWKKAHLITFGVEETDFSHTKSVVIRSGHVVLNSPRASHCSAEAWSLRRIGTTEMSQRSDL